MQDIHPQTLKKVMRLRMEQAEKNKDLKEVTEDQAKYGKLPPEDVATISTFQIAKITYKEK